MEIKFLDWIRGVLTAAPRIDEPVMKIPLRMKHRVSEMLRGNEENSIDMSCGRQYSLYIVAYILLSLLVSVSIDFHVLPCCSCNGQTNA